MRGRGRGRQSFMSRSGSPSEDENGPLARHAVRGRSAACPRCARRRNVAPFARWPFARCGRPGTRLQRPAGSRRGGDAHLFSRQSLMSRSGSPSENENGPLARHAVRGRSAACPRCARRRDVAPFARWPFARCGRPGTRLQRPAGSRRGGEAHLFSKQARRHEGSDSASRAFLPAVNQLARGRPRTGASGAWRAQERRLRR